MKSSERILGFLASMLVAFGITELNFQDLAFDSNQKAYASIGLGIFLGIIFFVRYRSSKS